MALSSSAEHIVIIGGGASSALTAVRLAERGFRVTVLEKAQVGMAQYFPFPFSLLFYHGYFSASMY